MRQVSPAPIGSASLPKRALSARATCPAGIPGIDAVVLLEFGTCDGDDGKLLGPKISLRVAGIGEIRPVDGVAENSEFCASACGTAATGMAATAKSKSANRSRPRGAAVGDGPGMEGVFLGGNEAVFKPTPICFLICLSCGSPKPPTFSRTTH